MRVFAFRTLSLVLSWGLIATAVIAAPPEKDAKPEVKVTAPAEKKVEAKPQVEKKAEADKKIDEKKVEVKRAVEAKLVAQPAEKKAEPAKAEATKAAAKPEAKQPEPAKVEAKSAVAEKKPAAARREADKKPVAAKTETRKPTRVDPADNAEQPKLGAAAKPQKAFTPGGKYVAGDMSRPRPAVIQPPTESSQNQPGRAPSDAIVLFDGATFDRWKREGGPKPAEGAKPSDEPLWVIKNGYMECQPRSGGIGTRDSFGDCQLHIEWATPSQVKGSSQGRGNSGVLLQGIGEVQVLDSYENDTYPDGQASAIYGKYPPLVNASRRPGEWQTYDIIVELAKIDPATKQLIRPARLTVLHNGVLTHIATEIPNCRATQFSFGLQDHGNPVRYRNIWLRPLAGYDAAGNLPLAAAKAEVKIEAKVEVKAATKVEAKTEAKPAVKAEAKTEAKSAAKSEIKPTTTVEAKTAVKAIAAPKAPAEVKTPAAPKKPAAPKTPADPKKPSDSQQPGPKS